MNVYIGAKGKQKEAINTVRDAGQFSHHVLPLGTRVYLSDYDRIIVIISGGAQRTCAARCNYRNNKNDRKLVSMR